MSDDESFINPILYDVMLTGFREKEAKEVSKKTFNFEMDCTIDDPSIFPMDGIIWGRNGRMLVPVMVKFSEKNIKSLFLYDGGFPETYLCQNTLHKLGISDRIADSMIIGIHGTKLPIYLSHGHFSDINVLGQSFMMFNKLNLTADFGEFKFSIAKKN